MVGWRLASQTTVLTITVVKNEILGLFSVEVIDVFESLFGDEFVFERFDAALYFRVFVWLAEGNE